jgi:hypothetical protein
LQIAKVSEVLFELAAPPEWDNNFDSREKVSP